MNIHVSARRVIASFFGIYAGFLAIEHGYFEVLQGNVSTNYLLINAIAAQPSNLWQGAEPALTIFPTFLVTGIFAILLGISVAVWSALFIGKKLGVAILAFLLLGQLLMGGGLAPLFVGLWAVVGGISLISALNWWRTRLPTNLNRLLARLLPWIFVAFLIVSTADLEIAVFGYNPGLLNALAPFVAFALPLLIVISALAYDIQAEKRNSSRR